MIFREMTIGGVFVVEMERREDHRGFFARSWCTREFAEHGLDPVLVQCGVSLNPVRGTLRGMHFQLPPHGESKLIRCTRGAMWDVALDVRTGSPTFRQHVAVELTEDNHLALYIPKGVAHGFQTLVNQTEVLYHMSEFFVPDAARGVRYNDPAFDIPWPIAEPVMLERDRNYPDYVA